MKTLAQRLQESKARQSSKEIVGTVFADIDFVPAHTAYHGLGCTNHPNRYYATVAMQDGSIFKSDGLSDDEAMGKIEALMVSVGKIGKVVAK